MLHIGRVCGVLTRGRETMSIEGGGKKQSVTKLLEIAVSGMNQRSVVEEELLTLTEIGNRFQIRHHEVDEVPISNDEFRDYLFYRTFDALWILLKSTGRTGVSSAA